MTAASGVKQLHPSPVVRRNLKVQLLHEKAHDVVAPAVDFQDGQIIFWRPLK